MNLTQNDRLKQVTFDTLIVGVDVGSKTHFCRAFDWRGFELSRRVFKFSNTGLGFLTFLRWTEELMNKTEMKKVIVGCEPTGCYWLTFQKFLKEHGVQLVTVNPFTVNRSMELDDNSPEKSDLKDPKTIALFDELFFLRTDAFQKNRSRLIIWILRHKLAMNGEIKNFGFGFRYQIVNFTLLICNC